MWRNWTEPNSKKFLDCHLTHESSLLFRNLRFCAPLTHTTLMVMNPKIHVWRTTIYHQPINPSSSTMILPHDALPYSWHKLYLPWFSHMFPMNPSLFMSDHILVSNIFPGYSNGFPMNLMGFRTKPYGCQCPVPLAVSQSQVGFPWPAVQVPGES